MADEADCPVCDGEHPVTWLITHLNPAATIRACEQDFEAAVLALLANRLEVDAGWLTDVVNGAVDAVNQDIADAGGVVETEAEIAEAEALQERFADGGDVGSGDETRTGYSVHEGDAEPVFEDE